MPAEWEPHAATWIAWPHNRSDWPGRFAPIPFVYADIVRHLLRGERVEIIVQNAALEASARRTLKHCSVPLGHVRFHRWPTDRVWTRDSGAIFIRNADGQVAATDWHFNAWAKYRDWKRDDKVATRMARALKVHVFQAEAEVNGKSRRLVLEGGSIDVNGRGMLITTEECLLSAVQSRNPGLSRAGIEQMFADYLGATKVVWLGRGIAGDDTHGHVDDICRFVAADTVVTVVENDRHDENHLPLQQNLARLRSATDQDGKPLRVAELPLPKPVVYRGRRLPASYANFYIANATVLVPTFNDPNDRIALDILAKLFPSRDVVGINCTDFIWGLGAVHCMTQQQPK